MSVGDLASNKTELRKSLNAWRSQFAVHLSEHLNERESLQQNYLQQLRSLCIKLKTHRVACYLPFGGEPDTSAFIQWCLDAGLTVLLPVSNPDNTLHWVEFDGVSTKTSIFGFAEPHGPQVSLEPVDLIIVPALAIDQHGNRLGKGKGYYDRALAQTKAPVAAVVYEHELFEEIPAEVHDKKVNWVVTQQQTALLGD